MHSNFVLNLKNYNPIIIHVMQYAANVVFLYHISPTMKQVLSLNLVKALLVLKRILLFVNISIKNPQTWSKRYVLYKSYLDN